MLWMSTFGSTAVSVFSTVAAAAWKLPAPITRAGSIYWLAVSVETLTPWYLVAYEVGEGDDAHIGTMCVAWETSLADMLRSAKVISIYCLVPSYKSAGGWRMSRVTEAREPSDQDQRHGPLFFQFAGEEGPVDSRREPVTQDVFKRGVLVFGEQKEGDS